MFLETCQCGSVEFVMHEIDVTPMRDRWGSPMRGLSSRASRAREERRSQREATRDPRAVRARLSERPCGKGKRARVTTQQVTPAPRTGARQRRTRLTTTCAPVPAPALDRAGSVKPNPPRHNRVQGRADQDSTVTGENGICGDRATRGDPHSPRSRVGPSAGNASGRHTARTHPHGWRLGVPNRIGAPGCYA